MPSLIDRDHCCGCSACVNICPNDAICMMANEEGFLHPVVNQDKCIECKACEKACPGLEPVKQENRNHKTFIVQHKDDVIRYQSTSGGAFTAIAEEIIRRGGVVFGATMTDDLKVKHVSVRKSVDLARFRNSKYVQSEIGECFKEAKALLISGKSVCFSGTPCQINGLYKFLGRDYENLISVDLVCKSVPSPLIFERYKELKRQSETSISDIVFRDKKRGFLYCTMAHYPSYEARRKSQSSYRRGSESDEWLRIFLSGKIARRSCTTCPYQSSERVGDITLGDIWETNDPEFDDNKGTTLAHIWTPKGLDIVTGIMDNVRIKIYIKNSSGPFERKNTIPIFPNREQLFADAHELSAEAFFSKYTPYNAKVKAKKNIRYMLWIVGLQTFVRHIKHLIIHR